MKNIFLVLKREYLVRVRKKSFIVMTLLTPLLMAALFTLPAYFASTSLNEKKVEIVDESGLFTGKIKDGKELKYSFVGLSIEKAKANFDKSGFDVLVHIPKDIRQNPKNLQIYAGKSVSLEVQMGLEKAVQEELENLRLLEAGIDRNTLENNKVEVSSEKPKPISTKAALMYWCIFRKTFVKIPKICRFMRAKA